MLQPGAVKIDGEKVIDTRLMIAINTKGVFQVGKRKFARISVN